MALQAVPDIAHTLVPATETKRGPICAREGCGRTTEIGPTGRPRQYCAPACRKAAWRQRRAHQSRELTAENLQAAVRAGVALAMQQWAAVLPALSDVLRTEQVDAAAAARIVAAMAAALAGQPVTAAKAGPASVESAAQLVPADPVLPPVETEPVDPANQLAGGTAREVWGWALSETCPTSWWKKLGRDPTGAELKWVTVEYQQPKAAAQLDRIMAAITDQQEVLGVRGKRMTHKDRRAAYKLVSTKTVTVEDLIHVLKWAVGEPFWGDYIADKGVPVHVRTAQKMIDQWRDAGAPDSPPDAGIVAAAQRLCTLWASLVGIGEPRPGWQRHAVEALRGNSNFAPLNEDEIAGIMRWMKHSDNARFYGGDGFPFASRLASAKGRRAAPQPGQQRRTGRASVAGTQATNSDGIYVMRRVATNVAGGTES